jgi:hypothetical protein
MFAELWIYGIESKSQHGIHWPHGFSAVLWHMDCIAEDFGHWEGNFSALQRVGPSSMLEDCELAKPGTDRAEPNPWTFYPKWSYIVRTLTMRRANPEQQELAHDKS